MNRLKQWYLRQTDEQQGRIPALDGVRTLLVLLIGWYHIWQQSWLTPRITLPWRTISLDAMVRSGYLWVDGLLLLSGFLLYLPYAQAREERKKLPRILPFYKRRALRIVPSYYLSILVMLLFVAIPQARYASFEAGAKDVLAHVTFTHTLFPFSYTGTPLNGALWTLGVEVQFYLLFPFLARAFLRKPVLTYVGMAAVAFAYRAYVSTLPDTTMLINQLPAFFDVYANGFVAASAYVAIKKRVKQDGWTRALFTGMLLVAVFALIQLAKGQASENGMDAIRLGQMNRRYILSCALSLAMLGAAFAPSGVRFTLGNPVTRVLSAVSFQFYIWHQVFAVRLRQWGFPPSQSLAPNMDGDVSWQIRYTFCCFAGALLIAALVTYLFEQPIAKYFNKEKRKKP